MTLNKRITDGWISRASMKNDCGRFPVRGDRVDRRFAAIAKTIRFRAKTDRLIAVASGFPAASLQR